MLSGNTTLFSGRKYNDGISANVKNEAQTGATFQSAGMDGCAGARTSTMIVTTIAITPSLKASSRLVVISDMSCQLSGNLSCN